VAQLGARFHGMEEVGSSNLPRSTTTFLAVTALHPIRNVVFGVQMESEMDSSEIPPPWVSGSAEICALISQSLSPPAETRQTRQIRSKSMSPLGESLSGSPKNLTSNPTCDPTKPDRTPTANHRVALWPASQTGLPRFILFVMWKAQIKPNTEYALREKRAMGSPFQRVRVIQHIRRNKWRVEWIDPNPGLVDYIESGQLVVEWKDRKAFLKEEESVGRLKEHNARHGYDGEDSPIVRALYEIFESVADGIDFYRGSITTAPEALERLKARIGSEVRVESPAAYVDRGGVMHLPFDVALDLAQRFCAAEPATVLVAVEATERKWSQKAARGEDYIVSLLNEYRASWALIRQWAGHDAAVAQREAEIQRLERLVWDAIYMLQKAGLDRESDRLRRGLRSD
jgi:hypothetical protein